MDIQLNRTLIEALRSIIVLPQRITSLDLRMRMDEAPSITVTSFVIGHQRTIERTDTFKLAEQDWLDKMASDAHTQIAQWFDDIRRSVDDAEREHRTETHRVFNVLHVTARLIDFC